jgi:citrate synthase
LERGDDLPGFGHPLYPDGDIRASAILESLPGRRQRWRSIAQAVEQLTGQRPSLDFALVALRRHLQLTVGAAFGIFALGRSMGWIAHALEQRSQGISLGRVRRMWDHRPKIWNEPMLIPNNSARFVGWHWPAMAGSGAGDGNRKYRF